MRSLAILSAPLFVLPWAIAFGQATTPVIIEALTDVAVEPQSLHVNREKGRLDYYRSTSDKALTVVIKKGQRSKMLQELGEGSCRIEVQGNGFDLQSCPWLPGFTHHEEDVYRVIQGRE